LSGSLREWPNTEVAGTRCGYQVPLGVDHQIYRYKILRGEVAERACDVVRQICHAREVVIIRGPVSADHIHMLVAAPAHMALSKLVQYIKGRSSRRLQEEFPSLRKRYWGQHLRARGLFCATVGAVDEETIKAYVENRSTRSSGTNISAGALLL